jgi:hypothetical protein
VSDLLTTAPHEGDVRLEYTEHGLDPYFALERILDDYGGYREASGPVGPFEMDFGLRYNDESGIGALNHERVEFETIREFYIDFEDANDPVGERSGQIHIAPRTPDMEDEDGDPINVPDMVGVEARVQASNLPFEYYEDLVLAATTALGMSERYLKPANALGPERHNDPDAVSNWSDYARYVRLDRQAAGRLHAVDGPLERLHRVGTDDRSGYRKHVADDTEKPGYYHTVVIDDERIGEVLEHHRYAKEVKVYLPRDPDSHSEESPLYHPKLEVALQTSRQDATVTVDDLDRLDRECEELLLNVLAWEDFPVTMDDSGGGELPWVEDAYWTPDYRYRNRRLVSDPTPRIEREQENVVLRHLADGLAEGDEAVLETLVTDGGEVAPKEIADRQGLHIDTVYRALDRLEDLVDHTYGEIRLKSHYVAERIAARLQMIREGFGDAIETAALALGPDGVDVDDMDAWTEWADQHVVGFEDPADGPLRVDLGVVDSLNEYRELAKDALQAWCEAGFREGRFRAAQIEATIDGRGSVAQEWASISKPRPDVPSRASPADSGASGSGARESEHSDGYSIQSLIEDVVGDPEPG